MRIAFAGVSSTGKTTLAAAIAKMLDWPLIEEGLEQVYDYCETYALPLSIRDCRKFTDADLANFEVGMYGHLSGQETRHENYFVTDSAAAVHMMYVYNTGARLNERTATQLLRGYDTMMRRYDRVFYLPFGHLPIRDDNRRLTHYVQLEGMDLLLQSILKKYSNVVTLDHLDLNGRILAVSNSVAQYKRSQRLTNG